MWMRMRLLAIIFVAVGLTVQFLTGIETYLDEFGLWMLVGCNE